MRFVLKVYIGMNLDVSSSILLPHHPPAQTNSNPPTAPSPGQALGSSACHNPSHRSPTPRPQTRRPVAAASALKARCPLAQHAATPPTGATHMPLPACFAGEEEGGGGAGEGGSGGTSLAQDKKLLV